MVFLNFVPSSLDIDIELNTSLTFDAFKIATVGEGIEVIGTIPLDIVRRSFVYMTSGAAATGVLYGPSGIDLSQATYATLGDYNTSGAFLTDFGKIMPKIETCALDLSVPRGNSTVEKNRSPFVSSSETDPVKLSTSYIKQTYVYSLYSVADIESAIASPIKTLPNGRILTDPVYGITNLDLFTTALNNAINNAISDKLKVHKTTQTFAGASYVSSILDSALMAPSLSMIRSISTLDPSRLTQSYQITTPITGATIPTGTKIWSVPVYEGDTITVKIKINANVAQSAFNRTTLTPDAYYILKLTVVV